MIELEQYPIDGRSWLLHPFGEPRARGAHNGIDIGATEGTPVVAPCDARVVRTLDDASARCGFGVVLEAQGHLLTFCHFRAMPVVEAGERVSAGDVLGVVGQTGNATGPHLHLRFTDRRTGADVDPAPALARVVGIGDDESPPPEPSHGRRGSGGGGLLALVALAVMMGRK